MKRCPYCDDFALYEDDVDNCPLCNNILESVSDVRSNMDNTAINNFNDTNESVIVGRKFENENSLPNSSTPTFLTRKGNRYIFRGIITEIHPQSRLHNKMKKWLNSLFYSEPYQFGNTSQSTIFRVEEFQNQGFANQKKDLMFYGDVEGRFNYGDDVTVTTKRKGSRYIVTRFVLNETQSEVHPTAQLSSGFIKLISMLMMLLIIGLVMGLVAFVTSGAILVLFNGLLGLVLKVLIAILPFGLVIYLFRALIKGSFK